MWRRWAALALCAVAHASAPRFSPPADWRYQTSDSVVSGKINIHVTPHTHDDTGWLWTVDQYYYQFVRYILDSVVESLAKDPKRKFNYVEMAFFSRWWEEQPESVKVTVRKLVASKQLVFLNGGWCMHDEASPMYSEMIDQTTRGHQFILNEFGPEAAPRATWQADPFGHSNTQAWLLSGEAGMPALFWARIDADDREELAANGDLEYIWRGSQTFGEENQVLGGVMWGKSGQGLYECPVSFEDYQSIGVQDNHLRRDYNVDRFVDYVVEMAKKQQTQFKGDHIMWTCGMDFNFKNANSWFHNMDALMHYVNQDGRVNMLYSTPEHYADMKNKDKSIQFKVREDDLFPLHEFPHVYWTGYFSSRVAFKRLARHVASTLAAARQVEFLTRSTHPDKACDRNSTATCRWKQPGYSDYRPPAVGSSWTDSLEAALAVAMHHDGISGTAKQHVNNDYAQRISEGRAETEQGLSRGLNLLLGTSSLWKSCHHINASVCEVSTRGTAKKRGFSVAIWNPLSQAVVTTLRIPVVVSNGHAGLRVSLSHWTAHGPTLLDQEAQLVPIDNRTRELPELYLNWFGLSQAQADAQLAKMRNSATHLLVAQVPLAPTAPTLVRVSSNAPAADSSTKLSEEREPSSKTEFDNGVYQVSFDPKTFAVQSITNLKTGRKCSLTVEWGYYEAGEKSGAYIFRPKDSTFRFPGRRIMSTTVVEGKVSTEIRQQVSPYASHVIRLDQGAEFVEVEYTAGPIPMRNEEHDSHKSPSEGWSADLESTQPSVGKELVLRYSSCIDSQGVYFTDSNGLEMQRRVRNERPQGHSQSHSWKDEPIASNYYPVNSIMSIEDKGARLAVVTDSTQGGASLADGQLEFMVLRRVFKDDDKGVVDVLNETMCGCNGYLVGDPIGSHCDEPVGAPCRLVDAQCHCHGLTVRGVHRIVFDAPLEDVRRVSRMTQFQPVLSFSDAVEGSDHSLRATFPAVLRAPLPDNLQLLTISANYASQRDGQILVRLQHTDDSPSSKPSTVRLSSLFSAAAGRFTSAREMTLTANLPIERKATYQWNTTAPPSPARPGQRVRYDPATTDVTLRPMEIRTFLVTFERPTRSVAQ